MTGVEKYRWLKACTWVVVIALGAIAGLSLLVEHRSHLWEYAPFLLLLACPLMHLFGHGGHRTHGAVHGGQAAAPERKAPDAPHGRGGDSP